MRHGILLPTIYPSLRSIASPPPEGLAVEGFIDRLRLILDGADPSSATHLSIKILLRDMERAQKRKVGQRERTRRCRRSKTPKIDTRTEGEIDAQTDTRTEGEKRYGNVTVTPYPNTATDSKDRYGNVTVTPSKEHVSTNHLFNTIKIDDLNLITGKRKRTSVPLPVDWELPASYAKLATSLGMEPEAVAIEALKFKSHHLAKGTKNSNWYFAWQGWCVRAAQKNKSFPLAKPLTQAQKDRAAFNEKMNRLKEMADEGRPGQHQIRLALGSPDSEIVPPNWGRPHA